LDDAWIRLGRLSAEATYVAQNGGIDGFGWTTVDLRSKFEFPAARMLAIAPRFAWHGLDGPDSTDLPAQLYDLSLEAIISLPLAETLFLQTAISPSIFTDGQNSSSDAFRLPGRALVFWTASETLTLSAGVAYLDREDISWLPSVGLIYKPDSDLKVEMIIPRPRVAWKTWTDGDQADWAYVAGELGGGSWGVQRASGQNDVATLGDYRLLLGWERLTEGSVDLRFEVGMAFNRSLKYVSGGGNRDLPGTGLVRFALTY